MNNQEIASKKIADFIYKKPEVVVAILKESGYDISVDTATLRQINELTFTALFNEEEPFTSKFKKVYGGDEYLNVVPLLVMGGASVVSSLIGGFGAKKQAKKQRDLQKALFLSDLTFRNKLEYEKLKLQGETDRTQILANSLKDYRVALQQESTKRLKDTWIYVVGIGLSISFIYGTYLTLKE